MRQLDITGYVQSAILLAAAFTAVVVNGNARPAEQVTVLPAAPSAIATLSLGVHLRHRRDLCAYSAGLVWGRSGPGAARCGPAIYRLTSAGMIFPLAASDAACIGPSDWEISR